MLKNFLPLLFLTIVFACNDNRDDPNLQSIQNDFSNPADQPNLNDTTKLVDTNQLTFQMFKDTKWIVGEIGVNGEQPDTLIFTKPDTLTYISTDTGKELCYYSFDKDTLTYLNKFIQTDINSLDEVNCENVNKLHYENRTFKYVYFDKKCSGDKVAKRFRMDTLEIRFRRI